MSGGEERRRIQPCVTALPDCAIAASRASGEWVCGGTDAKVADFATHNGLRQIPNNLLIRSSIRLVRQQQADPGNAPDAKGDQQRLGRRITGVGMPVQTGDQIGHRDIDHARRDDAE